LYNSSTGIGGQNVDCFTIVTYYDNGGTDRGWYVMDLPDLTIGPKNFFVAAAASPFTTQNNAAPGVVPNFNWNDPNFRNGSTGGSLTKWQVNGTGYTDVTASIPANLNNFMAGGGGEDYIVLVFVNGVFNNGFIGGSGSLLSGSTAAPLPGNLPVVVNKTFHPCSDFTINFNSLGAMESVGPQPGSDNGYARTSDGKCGAWAKTSNSVHHTPGVSNGSASGLTGSLTTAQLLQCNTAPGVSTVTYNITAVSGDATEADDFPVEVQLYYDYGTPGQLDGADVFKFSQFDALVSDPQKTFTINQTENVILVYKTKRGCFDKVFAIANGCLPLPVNLKSFTATRNRANVMLKWETMTEQSSNGFAVERNIGNAGWEQITFVPSQAPNGNSSDLLTYQYIDPNNAKGITQYRIKQVDIDNKSRLSEIRAVRGEGQLGKTIVYPNPTNDGRVTIVFEETNIVRDVTVMDMSGRIIRQLRSISNNNIQIDNLQPGMYSLRIVAAETGEQSVQKIVVNKR